MDSYKVGIKIYAGRVWYMIKHDNIWLTDERYAEIDIADRRCDQLNREEEQRHTELYG